jgi:hypothetical protein
MPSTEASSLYGWCLADENGAVSIGTQIPRGYGSRTPAMSRGEAFSASPRNLTPSIFPSYGRQPPTLSVIAVPRADRSLVVFREAVG